MVGPPVVLVGLIAEVLVCLEYVAQLHLISPARLECGLVARALRVTTAVAPTSFVKLSEPVEVEKGAAR